MDKPIPACLIVDDLPASPAYWARLQQAAFGYRPNESSDWGRNWRELASAPFWRVKDAHGFADLVEEFGIRGKCSFLPCPVGMGRIDQSVRGIPDAELKEHIAVVRDRLQPVMDITPEVLTHSMALDIETGGLLPHAESHWMAYLCATGNIDALKAYIRHGITILRNVGFRPHGLTVGGMTDVSGIAQGKPVIFKGHHRDVLGKALLEVEREFSSNVEETFLYTGSAPIIEASEKFGYPEIVYQNEKDRVFEIFSNREREDPLLPVLHGTRERVKEAIDAMICPELQDGHLVEDAEAGRAAVFTVHSQTLCALNTGLGLDVLHEILRRFQERYGKRIIWMKISDLCAQFGVKDIRADS